MKNKYGNQAIVGEGVNVVRKKRRGRLRVIWSNARRIIISECGSERGAVKGWLEEE